MGKRCERRRILLDELEKVFANILCLIEHAQDVILDIGICLLANRELPCHGAERDTERTRERRRSPAAGDGFLRRKLSGKRTARQIGKRRFDQHLLGHRPSNSIQNHQNDPGGRFEALYNSVPMHVYIVPHRASQRCLP